MDYVRNVLDWVGRGGWFSGENVYDLRCDDFG